MTRFTPAWAVAALATTSIAALMISSALAQQPPATPRPATPARPPAAAPAKPAQPAQAQPAQPGNQAGAPANPQNPQLIYTQWLKLCAMPDGTPADQKDPAAKGKQVCHTSLEARLESGLPLLGFVAIDPPGDAKKILRIQLPTGMHLQHGTRVIIDQGTPMTAPYVTCFPNTCLSEYPLDDDTLGRLKKGKLAYVQGILVNGSALSVPVALTEFGKVFDGTPTDPKVLEEQRKKMEDELKKKGEELQKKALEARQKLEQGGNAPAKPQ